MSTPYPGADGAGALQGFGQQWPMRSAAMMIAGGLEGCGPSQPPIADVNTISRRRRSGRPPGLWPAMAHAFRGNDDRLRLGDAMGVVRLLKEQQPDIMKEYQ